MTWLAVALLLVFLAALLRADWPLLRAERRHTLGRVTGHRRDVREGDECFAAVVTFSDEAGRPRQVVDEVYFPSPTPAIGAPLPVIHPVAQPEAARVFRPGTRVALYAVSLGTLLVLLLFADR